jgi:eukaryotic-like serine/threonine-protein kinase
VPALSSTTEFLDLIRQSGIYQADSLTEALTRVPDLPADPARAAGVLVQRRLLTKFQAKLLLNGRSKGFRLGPYIVQDQLGQGGMGTVFLAEHATLRRPVALKVLNPPKDVDGYQMAIERFLREARAAAALDHPNIVRIHDVAQQGSIYYLALEYVDGETLEQLLKKGGPITPSRAVGYIAQAAAGLQHADERGFVHRDIKPSNLILTKDQMTLKILDMGLARSFSREEDKLTEQLDRGEVTGTVDYMAPEQSLGATLDVRADIYSLGATFFTLLTGRPPFQGNTTQKLAQHQMKPAPSLSDLDPTLPPGLSAVVAKMLEKKPYDRYQTPAQVIAALGPWLGNSRTNIPGGVAPGVPAEGEGDAAQNTRGSGAASTGRRTTKRRKKQKAAAAQKRKLLIGASLLGVLVVGVIGGSLAFGDKKPEPSSVAAASGPPANNPPASRPTNNPPKGNPPKSQPPAVKPAVKPAGVPTGERLYHVDFADLDTSSRAVEAGEKVFAQQIGAQNLPLGWAINHHETAAAAEYLIANTSGARAIGIRNVRGGKTEILCRLDNVIDTLGIDENRVYRLTYQFDGPGVANAGLKVDKDPYTKLVLEPLTAASGSWQTVEFTCVRQTTDRVVFICNIAPDPKSPDEPTGTLWIRSVDVWKAGN